MAVLDWITPDRSLTLEGERIWLRPPRSADYRAWSEIRGTSRDFLQPWEPTWPADDLSRAAFRRRLSIYARDQELGQGYAFFSFRRADDQLIGGINLREVRRGVGQMAAIGYWVGKPYTRQGYGLEAVRTVSRFAFQQLGLHRLEAACVPENEASHRLLLKAGFEHEGRARAYLRIDGRWRDHLMFGLLNE